MSYTLQSGPFGICSGVWDSETQQYKSADNTDKIKCCLDNCKKTTKNCIYECKNIKNLKLQEKCYETCKRNDYACAGNCTLTSKFWSINNPIFKSTMFHKCGNGFEIPIKIDCMKTNKEKIIKHCVKHCLPSSDNSCTNECNYSFDFLTNNATNPLNITYSYPKINRVKGPTVSSDTPVYIVYSLAISTVLLGLYLLFWFKNQK